MLICQSSSYTLFAECTLNLPLNEGGHPVKGPRPSQSLRYMVIPVPSCFRLDRHAVERACSRACANTGNKIAAKIAMIAITTRSSMSVKPCCRVRIVHPPPRELPDGLQ